MSTSDTNFSKRAAKTAFRYLLITLFCAIFGAVYEMFSHDVYSFYMIYSFLFPLVGGTLPFMAISLFFKEKRASFTAEFLYHSGIATLTIGSIVRGILDIYGTTNLLTQWYWKIGYLLLSAGILIFISTNKGEEQNNISTTK